MTKPSKKHNDDASSSVTDTKNLTPIADTRTQAEKFEDAARELGCDEDEDRFKGVLRKLAKPKV